MKAFLQDPRLGEGCRLSEFSVFRAGSVLISPLMNTTSSRPVKNDEMQGARTLRNEAYNRYAPMTKDEAQRRRSRFSPACRAEIPYS